MKTLRLAIVLCLGTAGCGGSSNGSTTPDDTVSYDRLERLRFNQLAMQLNLPLFWAGDVDEDGTVDADEVRSPLFYPTEGSWVEGGQLNAAFDAAYREMLALESAGAPSEARRAAVVEELSSTAPTLVETDVSALPETHRRFAERMLGVAQMIDRLYARQVGMEGLVDRVAPDDTASQSLFRRNWGARCRGATTEANEACSAIDGAPAQPVGVYPAEVQATEGFCQVLEARENATALLTPFTVVREQEGELAAVPYTEAYRDLMAPVAVELRAAADEMDDADEEPLRTYLRAAAQAFEDNDWNPADEAWAAMNVRNSRWYVRVGPDEVYWDPCSHKAGFHLTFALINQGSLEWQDRLTPHQQGMEEGLAALAEEYEAREVSFHLPDFIDIVVNSGDDRDPFGATIGQSLPNWGPVSEEGRGRTVAMTNLYADPDSNARRRAVAESLFTADSMTRYTDESTPALLNTILHEATHNLGPSHEYRVNGQTDSEAFGGGLSSMLEELKAQSGALFFVGMLQGLDVIDEELQNQVYLDAMVWAMGHISRGMYTPSGQRKAYSQLAAVQVGFLMDHGALRWDPEASAANGTDQGAFSLDYAAFPAAVNELMTLVMHIKAAADRAEAERIATRFVDGDVVPQPIIVERQNRSPRASFVYAIH